ncbi:MAG: hypothetical protein HY961_17530 [Ignavibacteriae bacterium]|nr:hypothetical protein [Ignavibacteriota bacterium]
MSATNRVTEFMVGDISPDYVQVESIKKASDDKEKQSQIEKAIEELSRRAQAFSSNQEFWNRLLALLGLVRTATNEKNWIPAQQMLTEATVLVNRAISSQALGRVRVRLALAPLIWFALLYGFQALTLSFRSPDGSYMLITPEYFPYLWLGMLGGTTIVLWGIVKHGVEMTFDRSYIIWYLLKPLLGAIMGVIAVLIVQAGYFALQGDVNVKHPTSLLVLAFIGGFSERFFIQTIDRVITALLGGEKGASGKNSSAQYAGQAQLPTGGNGAK